MPIPWPVIVAGIFLRELDECYVAIGRADGTRIRALLVITIHIRSFLDAVEVEVG